MVVLKNKKMNKGEVTLVERVAEDMFLIKIRVAEGFCAVPGQFVSILCDNLTMRRPFSIMDFENSEISVLFKKKGAGTSYIANLKSGDTVDFIGAMGNGFSAGNKCAVENASELCPNFAPVQLYEKTLCVGAGVGVAPVCFLKKVLGKKSKLIAGFRSVSEIPHCVRDELDFVTTDDGSGIAKGSIVDYLEEHIRTYQPDRICVCGPHIVLKLVADIAKNFSIPCEVAMEKTMACSVGVCRGCVIALNRNGKIDNASVCKDGPVFLGEEIVW